MRRFRRAFDGMMERRVSAIPDAGLTHAGRIELVRAHGGFTQAYSTAVQEGLSHFGGPDGYVAWAAKMGSVVALADPVAADARPLLARFVEAARAPVFAEISHETAVILSGMGYHVARLGFDTALDLESYDFSGPRKERIRHAGHWLHKRGYQIVEEHDLPDPQAAVAALSAQWRASRVVKRREMAFMNRPFPEHPDPLTRRFVLMSPQDEAVALLYFDPVFRDGRTIGHAAVFKRRRPDAPSHAEHGLMKHAIERFRAEGCAHVFLSLAPLADPGPSGFRENAAFRWALARLFGSRLVNERVFNIRGHAEQRRRYYGRPVPRYFAWKGGSPFLALTATLRLCKAF